MIRFHERLHNPYKRWKIAIDDFRNRLKWMDYEKAINEAKELCQNLESDYEKVYYRGIISERYGKVALKRSTPRAKYIAYEHYRDAMIFFEKAQEIHPEGNQDAVLRWNACVRAIKEFKIEPAPDQDRSLSFLE